MVLMQTMVQKVQITLVQRELENGEPALRASSLLLGERLG
jgi:hypothetical protein